MIPRIWQRNLPTSRMKYPGKGTAKSRALPLLLFSSVTLLWGIGLLRNVSPSQTDNYMSPTTPPTLVSYSYFEKDDIQRDNFHFFLTAAMGVGAVSGEDTEVDYVILVTGDECSPCSRLEPMAKDSLRLHGVSKLRRRGNFWLLWRTENVGMDFGAHNYTLALMEARDQTKKYKYFMFLNSSVRGPFLPRYIPAHLHWSRSFTSMLNDQVKAVSSSITCLPSRDPGGYGPKLESWAFAIDDVALDITVRNAVFHVAECKTCLDGIVVQGEYGITISLSNAGYSIATLLYKYGRDVDWSDPRNWDCNNNAHPSRHGTYDGISMHPFETVFIKASWHVGLPFTDKYTEWRTKEIQGESTTEGNFNETMYFYAISAEAQDQHPLLEAAYKVPYNPPKEL